MLQSTELQMIKYLPGRGDTMIRQVGGFPRARLIPCALGVLTPAISPNAGNFFTFSFSPPGQGPVQPTVGDPASAGGLD